MREPRRVVLRDEEDGPDSRHLEAWIDEGGSLQIEGQDLGPKTAMMSPDEEYEWFHTVAAQDLPRLIEVLGGTSETDVLDLIEERYSGDASGEFERLLRTCGIPVRTFSC